MNSKLIYGNAINDAKYTVVVRETIGYVDGKQIQRLLWICPFFRVWRSMLERCYSNKFQKYRPTYIGCSMVDEWLTFPNFKAWMEKQDWEGMELDKDLLVRGNKVYSPDTCCFVSLRINSFLLERGALRGKWPIGVYLDKRRQKFVAMVQDGSGKQKFLGHFLAPDEAHAAWLAAKLRIAKEIALELLTNNNSVKNIAIAEAIVNRYENYEDIK